ncbi:MAG: hypothetical protein IOC03_28495, partial [Burkholderia sp.]|nr:hypothetical protein [Burkholderia sp.]
MDNRARRRTRHADTRPGGWHRLAFEVLAAHDPERKIAEADAAAPALDELARAQPRQGRELASRTMNLHVDMGRVDTKHA